MHVPARVPRLHRQRSAAFEVLLGRDPAAALHAHDLRPAAIAELEVLVRLISTAQLPPRRASATATATRRQREPLPPTAQRRAHHLDRYPH